MDELTAEQVRARIGEPCAALIGPHDIVMPLGEETTIGRDPARCELAILHASISAVHAVIARDEEGWLVCDAGSRNGTSVDGVPAPARLTDGARVRLGAVELTFSASPRASTPRRRRRTTMPGLIAPPDGGVVHVAGQTVHFTARELRLVQILAERRQGVVDDELAYVPAAEIAAVCGFKSIAADSDNVRELVLRVRRKFRAAGAGEGIHSRRGAGYRLAA
jgi:DNA-binding response OmpR family regulator